MTSKRNLDRRLSDLGAAGPERGESSDPTTAADHDLGPAGCAIFDLCCGGPGPSVDSAVSEEIHEAMIQLAADPDAEVDLSRETEDALAEQTERLKNP